MIQDFASILSEWAACTPDAPALTFGGESWTFAEFDRLASRSAQALAASGVRPGDRVGVLSRNCAEFYELIFACSKANVILVGLNWRLSALEIEAIIVDAEPALIFTGESEGALLSPAVRSRPGLRGIVGFGEDFRAWRDTASGEAIDAPRTPDDVAMILYTSGTTGLPKGAMLTHRSLSFTRQLGENWVMGPQSVNLVAMPLFHIGGCGYGTSTLLRGGHTVLMREADPARLIEAIERHRVTNAFFVPTVLQAILDVPGVKEADLGSLSLLMYGASPIGEALLRRALGVLDCGFIQAYGMTETSGTIVTLEPSEHHLEDPGAGRLRSCGRVLPFAEIRITDVAMLTECAPGQVGEIWVRSAMVMKGYWRQPSATAEAITPDGWLRTGDAAFRDADGFIYLFDRYKDMIISGGENIYPAEIENALLFHSDVEEVAVIGVPHERWGETPRAIVVPVPGRTPDPQDLLDFARTRLARYKCPTSVIFVQSLPRNASGKLLKKELRRLYR
jgi:acyl-CoA synthetase (AMP-forming)/AMP-acid ligase II